MRCVAAIIWVFVEGIFKGMILIAVIILVFIEEVLMRVFLYRRICVVVIILGGICVSDLWCRNYIGVCGGGVCVSNLWRRMSVSHKSVSRKRVKCEYPFGVSRKSVL